MRLFSYWRIKKRRLFSQPPFFQNPIKWLSADDESFCHDTAIGSDKFEHIGTDTHV
jgi:hypothetical protein